jgi:hypothetical protein
MEGGVNMDTELKEGVEQAIWTLLFREEMYTDVDLDDKKVRETIASALMKIAGILLEEDSDESSNSNS